MKYFAWTIVVGLAILIINQIWLMAILLYCAGIMMFKKFDWIIDILREL